MVVANGESQSLGQIPTLSQREADLAMISPCRGALRPEKIINWIAVTRSSQVGRAPFEKFGQDGFADVVQQPGGEGEILQDGKIGISGKLAGDYGGEQ